jgi:protein tyrosine phosphatase (PTP) superfamily phosphohydrolase (DUF442 family)
MSVARHSGGDRQLAPVIHSAGAPRRAIPWLAVCWLVNSSISMAAQVPTLDAPNVEVISPRLVTSGQPTQHALASLAAQGFGADIYLAPPTVSDAVHDEAGIVERQGVAYVNIPIKFDNPTEADFEAFSTALRKLRDRKVLVHCQLNMRASSMVFLYRVIVDKEDPERAYQAVIRVWVPEGPWRALMIRLLRKNHMAFEPY